MVYKTSGAYKKSKVIKSGKSKTFKVKKTTVLSLCAVKKSEKVTNQKLNKQFKQKKKAYYANYKYTISRNANTAAPTGEASTDAVAGVTSSPAPIAGSVPEGTPPEGVVPPTGSMPPENPPSTGTATADPEGKRVAKEKLDAAESLLAVSIDAPVTKTPSLIGDGTPVITLTADGMNAENLGEGAAVYSQEGNLRTLTINKAGTYVLTGGTVLEPVTNTEIIVAGNILEEVNLIWDHLVIDNRALGKEAGEDVPVFHINKSTSDVHVTLKGSSVLTGNGAYTESPAAVICADDTETMLTFSAYEGDGTASLTVVDGMDADMDFGENDPSVNL